MWKLVGKLLVGLMALLIIRKSMDAIRLGRIQPSTYDRVYFRKDNPVTYWSHVIFSLLFGSGLLTFVVYTLFFH